MTVVDVSFLRLSTFPGFGMLICFSMVALWVSKSLARNGTEGMRI